MVERSLSMREAPGSIPGLSSVTWWRNGSAFDSRSKGWGFDSLSRHVFTLSPHSSYSSARHVLYFKLLEKFLVKFAILRFFVRDRLPGPSPRVISLINFRIKLKASLN